MPDDVEATYIRIPLPIKDALRETAKKERRPLSAQVVVVLDEWFKREKSRKAEAVSA